MFELRGYEIDKKTSSDSSGGTGRLWRSGSAPGGSGGALGGPGRALAMGDSPMGDSPMGESPMGDFRMGESPMGESPMLDVPGSVVVVG